MSGLIKSNKGSITLEFAICGIIFIGFVFGMVMMGLWMYNVSHVKQAARIAAHNISVTGDPAESRERAMKYLNKTLVACPSKEVAVYGDQDSGYGAAEAQMNPLFPGFQKLIDPKGTSTINGMIQIRREAVAVREFWLRPENQGKFNP